MLRSRQTMNRCPVIAVWSTINAKTLFHPRIKQDEQKACFRQRYNECLVCCLKLLTCVFKCDMRRSVFHCKVQNRQALLVLGGENSTMLRKCKRDENRFKRHIGKKIKQLSYIFFFYLSYYRWLWNFWNVVIIRENQVFFKCIPWPGIWDSGCGRRKRYDADLSILTPYPLLSGLHPYSAAATPEWPSSPEKLPCAERCDQTHPARWPHCGSVKSRTPAAGPQSRLSTLLSHRLHAPMSGIWGYSLVVPDSFWTPPNLKVNPPPFWVLRSYLKLSIKNSKRLKGEVANHNDSKSLKLYHNKAALEEKKKVKMGWSARIVLVLRFHRTLATPETFTLTCVSPPFQPRSAHKLRCL